MCIESGKIVPAGRLVPPYDTGKVKIGLAYAFYQPWTPSADMYRLQSALLARSSIRVTWFERLSAFFSDLLSHRGQQ